MPGKKSAIYGTVMNSRGQARNMEVLEPQALGFQEKAGFNPERLDSVVQSLIQNAEGGAELLKKYTPMLAQAMSRLQSEMQTLLDAVAPMAAPTQDGEVRVPRISDEVVMMLELVGQVSVVLERVNKMAMQSSKSLDDVTRLRTFLVTGDEDRSGLEGLGENQLRRMITEAAMGWMKTEGNA